MPEGCGKGALKSSVSNSEYDEFDPEDDDKPTSKKVKMNKDGTVDKRSTKAGKKKNRERGRDHYANGKSGIRDKNDEITISGGGCALIVTHMIAYKEEEDSDSDDDEEVDEKKKAGDEDDEDDEEEDEEEEEEEYEIGKLWGPLGTSGDPGHKTKFMVIGGEKVYTGLFFKALPADERSSFSVFAGEALGITKRKKNGTYKGTQQWVEVEGIARGALTRDQGKHGNGGNGLGFGTHPENPCVRANYVLPSNPNHWSRRGKHLFFKKNWTYANCPGFFWDGRTLSGYLRGIKITTVEQFREWQAGYGFVKPVLEDVYLHELNCRKFREHKASGVAGGDWDYKESLDELENGELDLGGDERVDFYDAEEEEEDNA